MRRESVRQWNGLADIMVRRRTEIHDVGTRDTAIIYIWLKRTCQTKYPNLCGKRFLKQLMSLGPRVVSSGWYIGTYWLFITSTDYFHHQMAIWPTTHMCPMSFLGETLYKSLGRE